MDPSHATSKTCSTYHDTAAWHSIWNSANQQKIASITASGDNQAAEPHVSPNTWSTTQKFTKTTKKNKKTPDMLKSRQLTAKSTKSAQSTPKPDREIQGLSGTFGDLRGLSGTFGDFRGLSGTFGDFRGPSGKRPKSTKRCFKMHQIFRGPFRGPSGTFGDLFGDLRGPSEQPPQEHFQPTNGFILQKTAKHGFIVQTTAKHGFILPKTQNSFQNTQKVELDPALAPQQAQTPPAAQT